MSPMLGMAIAVAVGDHRNVVESFCDLTERTPTRQEIRKALDEGGGASREGRLARAYYMSMWLGRDAGLSQLIRSTRYHSYGRALEALPYAVRHLARRGIFAPLAATMSWQWDGAPAEVIGDAYYWCAAHLPSGFGRIYAAQTRSVQRRVVQLAAGASVTDGTYAPKELRRATAKQDKVMIRFWYSVIKKPD